MMKFDGLFGKRLCVAVSGGIDSMSLLHYCKAHEKELGYSLCAVHCEHGIRGEESLSDMRLVQETCEKQNVPLYVFSEDCIKRAEKEKCSLETAARNFRYEKFSQLIKENKADFVATAHHKGDEAETTLFRLARGTSLSGVRGMTKQNGWLFRPFLDWPKEKIIAYAKENGIVYHDDKTNFQTDATRNKLRLTVLPALEEAVPGATENILRFANIAAEDDEYLYKQSEKLLARDFPRAGEITVFFSEEKPLFRRACLTALKNLGVERDYTALHLKSLFTLQTAERGARLNMPKGVEAEKTTRGIVFRKTEETQTEPIDKPSEKAFDENGFDGGRYAVNVFSGLSQTANSSQGEWKVLRLDKDKLPEDAVFRFRREGDEIEKFGGGTKSLKKFFNEKKIPVKEREFLPLVASEKGSSVYAVCGVEIADGIKVTKDTQRVLYITLQKK